MALKRREPVDAFGASLLDVLSNLFGALILLMLIIAVLIRNDIYRLYKPDEGSVGQRPSNTFLKPKPAKEKLQFLVAEITLTGEGDLRTEVWGGDAALSSRVSLCEGEGKKIGTHWLALRQGSFSGTWSVIPKSTNHSIEGVCVEVKIDGLSVCSIAQPYRSGNLLKVKEIKNGLAEITVAGKPCNTVNSKKDPCK